MLAVALVLILLGGWELYVRAGGVEALILPAPTQIASALVEDRGLLWDAFAVTAAEILLGVALAIVLGALLAAGIHASRTLRRAVYPLLLASQTIPIVVIAPLLVVWLGFDIGPKLLIVALVCFFPVVVNTLDGLASVDPDLRKLLRTLDASAWETFRRVELPTALPGLFTGARIAVTVAAIGAVLAEQAGTDKGIGLLIEQASSQLETARAYAAVVLLSALAIALYTALTLVERRALPWADRHRGGTV